jgi:hypothetical protein
LTASTILKIKNMLFSCPTYLSSSSKPCVHINVH